MKRINKIKYGLILVVLLIIIAVIFPTFMRYKVSVTANVLGYAQNPTYIVEYNANGGAGSMEAQEFESTVAQNLYKSTFSKDGYSFAFWNTKADGTGKSYEDEEEVNNLGTKNGQTVTLYAMYEKFSYEDTGDHVFNGTSDYINTEIYLFSKKNINKNFEISFEIKDYTSKKNQDTLFSSMDETESPWPGFVFRFDKNTNIEIIGNATKGTEKRVSFPQGSVSKIKIKRIDGILYINTDDGEDKEVINFSTIKHAFYAPLSIGASLNANLTPQRYFEGTLSNIKVTLQE